MNVRGETRAGRPAGAPVIALPDRSIASAAPGSVPHSPRTIDEVEVDANGDGMTLPLEQLEDLRRRREEILAGGGAEKLARRREKGLMTARDRLDALFEEATFQELGAHVQHSGRFFGMEKKALAADGVVAGSGYVGGRQVSAFSQDFTVVGGSLGKMHAQEDRDADAAGGQVRHPGRGVQGFGRRAHPGGSRRAVRLRLRLLHECPAVGRRPADRRRLRSLRGRGGLFAGADGFRRDDAQQRLHVHHRARSDQGGDRQGGDDGGGRRRRHARRRLRQRPFPRRGRRRRDPHRPEAALLPARQQFRRPAASADRGHHARARTTQSAR